jgi:hypothetical protein
MALFAYRIIFFFEPSFRTSTIRKTLANIGTFSANTGITVLAHILAIFE